MSKLRIVSQSYSRRDREGSATVEGLSFEEVKKLEGSIVRGAWWIRGSEDGLETASVFEEIPNPVADETMIPFWRRPSEEVQLRLQEIRFESDRDDVCSPSILIQSLCGYNFTPERYQKTAERLESFGFIQMRSRRGNDGRHWEVWYLPGLWASDGDLRDAIDGVDEGDTPQNRDRLKLEAAIEFLSQNPRWGFGTLDVATQRLAMVIE